MRIIKDVCYSAENDGIRLLDICLPETDAKDVFVYFHGGGIESGDKESKNPVFECLCKKGIAVVTANYRMYPAAKFPEFVEDAAECCDWVVKNIKKYTNAERIFVGGSSAGGYLSMLLCFVERYLGKYGLSPLDFAGFIHNAGQPTAHFNVLKERGIDSRRLIVDETAPLYFIGTSEKYPPMLFIVGDKDMPNRYEQTLLTVSTLKHFGHTENIKLIVLHGTHCEQDYRNNSDGENELGAIVAQYIESIK